MRLANISVLPGQPPVNNVATKFIACLIFFCNVSWAQIPAPSLPHQLAGGQFEYTVQQGDFLISIGARFGESAQDIAQNNGIPFNALIFPGQRLSISNRHIVPEDILDGIVINVPQRMLFHFQAGTLTGAFPVGLGRPSWPTLGGEFQVVEMRKSPIWNVPQSIQEEMRLEGKEVTTRVSPGEGNPLGDYWIGLSLAGYGIHGTNVPASVYHFQSHGCIRLHPDDARLLFSRISVGTQGKILYAPLLLAKLDNGRIFLEVNRDIYDKGGNTLTYLKELAAAHRLTDQIDWQKAAQVVELQEGIARRIDLPGRGQ